MRVSFIGEYFNRLEDVVREAEKTAAVTHNHPEGIKGAVATAVCIWMAKNGKTKEEVESWLYENFDASFQLLSETDEEMHYQIFGECLPT